MLAIARVAHVNGIELAVHTVLIILAIGNTARNAAINLMAHSAFLLAFIMAQDKKIYTKSIDKPPFLL